MEAAALLLSEASAGHGAGAPRSWLVDIDQDLPPAQAAAEAVPAAVPSLSAMAAAKLAALGYAAWEEVAARVRTQPRRAWETRQCWLACRAMPDPGARRESSVKAALQALWPHGAASQKKEPLGFISWPKP